MYILGIHLDFPHVRASLLRIKRQGIEIRALKSDFEPPYPNVKQLYISGGGLIQNKNFTGRTVSGISTKNTLIRPMELKVTRHIEEAIAFQSEALSHFKPEEILTVPLLKKREKGTTEAILFTVARDALKNHLSELEKIEIDPDSVSTVSLALCHFIRWKFPQLLNAFIIDLGSSETSCVLMQNGELKKAHGISIGIETLLSAFFEDRKRVLLKKEIEGAAQQIDLLLLKPGLNPQLSAHLMSLKQEIGKVFYSFCRDEKYEVIFTGRSDAFIHLQKFLMDFDDTRHPLTQEEQKYAIPIGLAIENASSKPLQLRRKEFFPKKNWARMGSYAIAILATSVILSAALLGFGIRSSQTRKAEMLRTLGISEKGVDNWINAIEKNNKEYTYLVQAPKVAEVLEWMSSHPLLQELKAEGDPITLKELHYQLVSFPNIDHPKEPYLAKVEIEFQFASAMNARRFHEALRKSETLVNPDLEITWDALSSGYRTSFFLKNRSPYVP